MLRSFCNISKLFAARNIIHQYPRIVSPLLIQNPSYIKYLHSSVILLQNTPSSSSSEDTPTVYVSGISVNQGKRPYCAIYWGDNDSLNILEEHSTPGASLIHAVLKSMTLALQQAINQRKLNEVIIKTDSEYIVKAVNEYLKYWRKNGYTKKDGSSVKHRDEIEKMDQLLSMINAKVELLPKSGENYVLRKLKENSKHAETVGKLTSGIQAYDPKAAKSKNVIFVCGAISDGPSKKAGYGIHFKGNDELDIRKRFSEFPVSRPRALMRGIIEALYKVKSLKLKDIQIVTDDIIFLKSYQNGWKKADGSSVKNELFYERIKKLADELNVSFRFVSEDDNNPDFKNALVLAHEGIETPTVREKEAASKHVESSSDY